VSGTKKLFMMTQQASELNADGKTFDEIVTIIADDWNMNYYMAEAIVKSWWDGKIMQNFDWSEEKSIGN
jgi:hypothetical protein